MRSSPITVARVATPTARDVLGPAGGASGGPDLVQPDHFAASQLASVAVDHAAAHVPVGLVHVANRRPPPVQRREGVHDDVLGGLLVVDQEPRKTDQLCVVDMEQLRDRSSAIVRERNADSS